MLLSCLTVPLLARLPVAAWVAVVCPTARSKSSRAGARTNILYRLNDMQPLQRAFIDRVTMNPTPVAKK